MAVLQWRLLMVMLLVTCAHCWSPVTLDFDGGPQAGGPHIVPDQTINSAATHHQRPLPEQKGEPVWNISLLFGTTSALSWAFSLLFFAISLGALTSLVIATSTDSTATTNSKPKKQTPEVHFIRSIVAFFATVSSILFGSIIVLSAAPPSYLGFGRPGLPFIYFLVIILIIWSGMIWTTVFLYAKRKSDSDSNINRWGCDCTKSRQQRTRRSNSDDSE